MRRAFSKRQRLVLRMLAGNLCMICSKPLNNDLHADHVVPFSRGGKTILRNGQALCSSCNLAKGAKIV